MIFKFGNFSFRTLLLTGILLLNVPILLTGVYITYRKTESSLQETARRNLTESAVRKADTIDQVIQGISSNLINASQTTILKSSPTELKQKFIQELSQQLPKQVNCIQLVDINTKKNIVSTCGNNLIIGQKFNFLISKSDLESFLNAQEIHINFGINYLNSNHQLKLVFSTPIYNSQNQIQYLLNIESSVLEQQKSKRGSLEGNTVVITENGTILAHPFTDKIGDNINNEPDKNRLKGLIRDAIAGNQNFQHLFYLGKSGEELLAGYTAINSPITVEKNKKWIILAIQTRKNALADINDIRGLLIIMTMTLIVTSVLASIVISRMLALPVEKLTEYTLKTSNLHEKKPIPEHLLIKEINQLAIAIASMINKLITWGEEIETAWKEAQTANQLKGEFLATTSHELRTPLNGIIGCIRLVKDDCCDSREEEIELLEKADESALHLLTIINDILDISRIESGKMSVLTESVNLPKLIKEVINLQRVVINEKNLSVKIPNTQENILVRADINKLKQVLLNILNNAIKFTEKGGINIDINADTENNNQIILIIEDTGIGINEKEQNKLFKPFVMIDGGTTRKYGGTGLGLAISKKLMELMSGDIKIFSLGKGKGTKVEIYLPKIES
jgi:two-component system, NarL family, sensor histidine kinase BarA